MNIISGLVCCFCFGFGLISGQYYIVLCAAILGYFVSVSGLEN